ncbi:MAG: hypothetical protein KC944_21615, partial [Candidatus Omnitrophica bacterium]|nr:hypothetical protein [Candidatus Omnitrophota bacterium]
VSKAKVIVAIIITVSFGLVLVILYHQGGVNRTLEKRIQALKNQIEETERDAISALDIITGRLDETKSNQEHSAEKVRKLQEDYLALSEKLDSVTRYLDADQRRLEMLEKIIRRIISLGARDSLIDSLSRAGVIREGDSIFELFDSTLICFMSLGPSEQFGVEGRVHPIAIYNDGILSPPVIDPKFGTKDWELIFDLMGDLNIRAMGNVTVSSVTDCGHGDNYSIAGLVHSASNPGLDELYDNLPPFGESENCEGTVGFGSHTAKLIVTSMPLETFHWERSPKGNDAAFRVRPEGRGTVTEMGSDGPPPESGDCHSNGSYEVFINSESMNIEFEGWDYDWAFQFLDSERNLYSYQFTGCLGQGE